MLMEKEVTIEKLKSDLDRLKLNNKIANNIVDSHESYNNINDVTAKRLSIINNAKKPKKIPFATQKLENTLPIKPLVYEEMAKRGKKAKRKVVLKLKDLCD